jgi:hypothetical protein
VPVIKEEGSVTPVGAAYVPALKQHYLAGTLTGDTADITVLSAFAEFRATITLTSENEGELTVINCVPFPDQHCAYPTGATFRIVRIF